VAGAARTFVLAALALAVGGCAPLASFRPASGLTDGHGLEVGLGAAMVTPRPYVLEKSAGAGQAWVSGEPKRWLGLSAITAFDDKAAGFGGAVRFYFVRERWFALGADTEAGYAWVNESLPLAFRPIEPVWIYAAPRLGNWGIEPIAGVLGGLDVHVYQGFIVRAEAQASWQNFMYYNRRNHYGAALAYQF
jgi:hypothetical protein